MSKRILVVDPSRTIQTLLHTYFNIDGHCVITCSTQEEALQVFAVLHDVPDIVFLTVNAGKEAYRLINYVKEHAIYAHTRIIAMVLATEKASIQRALSNASISYLVKPFQIQDVLALISPSVAAASNYAR